MTRSAAWLLVLLWTPWAVADEPRRVPLELQPDHLPTRPGEVHFVSRLDLGTISPTELTAGRGSGAVDLGNRTPGRLNLEAAPVNLLVTRTVPALWRAFVDDTDRPMAVDVRYEVIAANGTPRRLSHLHHPEAELGVVVEPIPAHVVSRGDEGTVLEGGFVLQISLDETRYAGQYSGTVVVSIRNL